MKTMTDPADGSDLWIDGSRVVREEDCTAAVEKARRDALNAAIAVVLSLKSNMGYSADRFLDLAAERIVHLKDHPEQIPTEG